MANVHLQRLFFMQIVAWAVVSTVFRTEPHGTDGSLVSLHWRPQRPIDLPLTPFTDSPFKIAASPNCHLFYPAICTPQSHVVPTSLARHRRHTATIKIVAWAGVPTVFRTEPHGTDGSLVSLHRRSLHPIDLPLPPFTDSPLQDHCIAILPPVLPRLLHSLKSRGSHVTGPTLAPHRYYKSTSVTRGPSSGLGNNVSMANAHM
ncbi:uncharacterized protein LOC142784026 [Rhipicephalus microplus]|uniref:uncharacterized protein LOC142784026 n=1 Tax=Rhipicephalus microplus TaxID=6941 RepID=UPI003F6CDFCC